MHMRLYSWIGVAVSAMFIAMRPAGGEPQDSASVRRQFVGTWKLVSTEEKLRDGSVRPYKETGPRGLGYLMYSADGYMCAQLMNPDRPKWDDPPTASQKISAIEGFIAYCGKCEIDAVNHVIWHYPDLAWKPNFVGTKQSRPYRFEGHRLVFSDKIPAEEEGDVEQWTIVWEKVK
jgi:hypothetical protein